MINKFRRELAAVTGIVVGPNKDQHIYHRLSKRLEVTGINDLTIYLDRALHEPSWKEELATAIDLMTTNTTHFFREPNHFRFLSDTMIPDLSKQLTADAGFHVKIWSAASSDGSEAYTTAMVLSELQQSYLGLEYSILGTDLSPSMISTARLAIYKRTQIESIPKPIRQKYLMTGKSPEYRDYFRIVPHIRKNVAFKIANLKRPDSSFPTNCDLVFLRNVLIYFDGADQANTISRVVTSIKPGGFLLVGHAESMIVNHPQLMQVTPSIFKKF